MGEQGEGRHGWWVRVRGGGVGAVFSVCSCSGWIGMFLKLLMVSARVEVRRQMYHASLQEKTVIMNHVNIHFNPNATYFPQQKKSLKLLFE